MGCIVQNPYIAMHLWKLNVHQQPVVNLQQYPIASMLQEF